MQLNRQNGEYTIDRNPAMAGFITPNAHEKSEWSRMAQAAYAARRNDVATATAWRVLSPPTGR